MPSYQALKMESKCFISMNEKKKHVKPLNELVFISNYAWKYMNVSFIVSDVHICWNKIVCEYLEIRFGIECLAANPNDDVFFTFSIKAGCPGYVFVCSFFFPVLLLIWLRYGILRCPDAAAARFVHLNR